VYICESCGNVSKAGESANKVVVQTRPSPSGKGREIVREALVCSSCLDVQRVTSSRDIPLFGDPTLGFN
jgi:hypothetical protein